MKCVVLSCFLSSSTRIQPPSQCFQSNCFLRIGGFDLNYWWRRGINQSEPTLRVCLRFVRGELKINRELCRHKPRRVRRCCLEKWLFGSGNRKVDFNLHKFVRARRWKGAANELNIYTQHWQQQSYWFLSAILVNVQTSSSTAKRLILFVCRRRHCRRPHICAQIVALWKEKRILECCDSFDVRKKELLRNSQTWVRCWVLVLGRGTRSTRPLTTAAEQSARRTPTRISSSITPTSRSITRKIGRTRSPCNT